MNGPLDLLRFARRLLAEPQAWTQKTPARDVLGRPTFPTSTSAVCWCSSGALVLAESRLQPLVWDAVGEASRALDQVAGTLVEVYQDRPGRLHAQVLAVFDRAIAALERRAAA